MKKILNDKRGISLVMIFWFIVVALLGIIILGVVIYGYNTITTSLTSVDLQAGAVNFSNATSSTMGQINNALLNNSNLIGILFLFGLVFGLVFGAYITRDENPMIFLLVDIIILIFAYVLATYISNAYETILNNIPFASVFTTNLNQASSFLLNLPLVTVITGVLVMIVSYSSIPKSKQEEIAGF